MKKYKYLSDNDKALVRVGSLKSSGTGLFDSDLELLTSSEIGELYNLGLKSHRVDRFAKSVGWCALACVLISAIYFTQRANNFNLFLNSIETPDICSIIKDREDNYNISELSALADSALHPNSYTVIEDSQVEADKLDCNFFLKIQNESKSKSNLQFVSVKTNKMSDSVNFIESVKPRLVEDPRGDIRTLTNRENYYEYGISVGSSQYSGYTAEEVDILNYQTAAYVNIILGEKLPKNSSIKPYI